MSMFRNTFKILYKKVYDALPKEYQWRTKRDLQREADIQRLFLLTTYCRRAASGVEGGEAALAEVIVAEYDGLSHEHRIAAVAENIQTQVQGALQQMHGVLTRHGDPLSTAPMGEASTSGGDAGITEEPKARRSGLAALLPEESGTRSAACHSTDLDLEERGGRLTMGRLSASLRGALGYSLAVAPSGIPHKEAGLGLWLKGSVLPGTVVALYPGVIYNNQQYKFIPGYPQIDRDNSYLLSRYDGVVIDAKPWEEGDPYGETCWPPVGLREDPHGIDIDGRNPMALAHFANHPPPGRQPNVMVAAVDLQVDAEHPHLRRYIPNLLYEELLPGASAAVPPPVFPGLCFVATEHLEDEELFLNYRYSPHVPRPSWYVPVDVEEDKRRWAT